MIAGKRLWIFFFLLVALPVTGQQRKIKEQLQKEKQQQLDKIRQVEKILSETSSRKKSTLGELYALNQRILVQENLIRSINEEINLLNQEIAENNSFVLALEEDLNKLRAEYTSMLFAAQKASSSINRLIFLFSSSSFDQLLMRLQYMKQYADQRKIQAEAITRVQAELMEQIKISETIRAEKNKLLAEELAQSQQLAALRNKQQAVLRNLEKEEKTLKRDLEETRKAVARLDKMISDLIREETERAAREARNRSAAAAALSGSFEENRKKLAWPVNGFVAMGFGRQNHPALKGVVIDNQGINIQTAKGEKVRCVFSGEVRQVAFIPPIGNSVIISHGEYYTVYAGLREVFVKRGDQVAANQEIGEVLSNSEGISELRFQIRKNTTALDPLQWLRN